MKWIRNVPIDRLLLESDSPALAPDKNTKNSPWNVLLSAQYIAQLHNIPVETVIEMTTRNAFNLFRERLSGE